MSPDVRIRGVDSFGRFTLRPGACACCGVEGVVLMYGRVRFPRDVQPQYTILKRPRARIGVSCGCYGRLHRQIAHVVDSIERRS